MVVKSVIVTPDSQEISNSGVDGRFFQSDSANASTWTPGDQLDVAWSPTEYTPDTSPSEVSVSTHLTAHLAGISNRLQYTQALESFSTLGYGSARLSANDTTTITANSDIKFDVFENGGSGSVTFDAYGRFHLKANRSYRVMFKPRIVSTDETVFLIYDHTSSVFYREPSASAAIPGFSAVINRSSPANPASRRYGRNTAILRPTVDSIYSIRIEVVVGTLTAIRGGIEGCYLSIIELPSEDVILRTDNTGNSSLTDGVTKADFQVSLYTKGSRITVGGSNDEYTFAVGKIYRVRVAPYFAFTGSGSAINIGFRYSPYAGGDVFGARLRWNRLDNSVTSNDITVTEALVDARSAARTIAAIVESHTNVQISNSFQAGHIYAESLPDNVNCLSAIMSGDQNTVTTNATVDFDSVETQRGIALSSSGAFTLEGGKSYEIRAGIGFTMATVDYVIYGLRKTGGSELANIQRVKAIAQDLATTTESLTDIFEQVVVIPEGQGGQHEFFLQEVHGGGNVDILSTYSWLTIVELPSASAQKSLLAKVAGRVKTTDATVTEIFRYTTQGVNNRTISAKITIAAYNTGSVDPNETGATYTIAGRWSRNNTGTVASKNLIFVNGPDEDDPDWNITTTISGDDIIINVVGEAATTIQWTGHAQFQETPNLA